MLLCLVIFLEVPNSHQKLLIGTFNLKGNRYTVNRIKLMAIQNFLTDFRISNFKKCQIRNTACDRHSFIQKKNFTYKFINTSYLKKEYNSDTYRFLQK